MKRLYMMLILVTIFVITGCAQQKETILNLQNEKREAETYKETDSLKEQLELQFIEIPVPEHANVSSWTVYDNMVYYGVDYIDYLTDHEGKGITRSEKDHYTKIISYDIQSEVSETLYEADSVIAISDVCTNGKQLIWEEYPRQENLSWCVKLLALSEDNSTAETILSDNNTEGELFDIIPNLTAQNIYWYDLTNTPSHPIHLFRYNLEKKDIAIMKENLDLSSSYEQVSIMDDQICTYAMNAVNNSKYLKTGMIYIDNLTQKHNITLSVPTKVIHPIANHNYCIWGESYEENDRLWAYDFLSKQLQCISLKEIGGKFSYTLLDDLIIVPTYNGIWCMDPKSQTYANLVMYGENDSFGHIWYNSDCSACTEIGFTAGKLRFVKIIRK